jgi:hypothetical protein
VIETNESCNRGKKDYPAALFGKFATPDVTWNEDEPDACLRDVSIEWEQEFNEIDMPT